MNKDKDDVKETKKKQGLKCGLIQFVHSRQGKLTKTLERSKNGNHHGWMNQATSVFAKGIKWRRSLCRNSLYHRHFSFSFLLHTLLYINMSGFNIATPSITTPAVQTPSVPTPMQNPTTPFALPSTPAPIDAPTPSNKDQNPYAVAGITPILQ